MDFIYPLWPLSGLRLFQLLHKKGEQNLLPFLILNLNMSKSDFVYLKDHERNNG
jgi:hypothetical protein